MKRPNPNKELYSQLRVLSCEQLWGVEVPRFDQATPQQRIEQVAIIRAVGVVFSESGTVEQKNQVRPWLLRLLQDPCEKIRRYAMAAMPKIGAGADEESRLLSLLRTTPFQREKKFLGQTLEKIGGIATLTELEGGADDSLLQTQLKVKASLARAQSPSSVRTNSTLCEVTGLRIHLRGRRGLERMVLEEAEAYITKRAQFCVAEVRNGLVALAPIAPFSLGDIYSLRCFGTVGLVLGTVTDSNEAQFVETVASMIASPLTRRILETFTEGSLRYRLDFVSKGHQRSLVRRVANRAYALCPPILNDARHARWTVAIHPAERGHSVELCPQLTPDPRFAYRRQDVPAASHPPLAACLARLGGRVENDVVWDPFCGSGMELVERALLGGVRSLYGTDLSAEAVGIAQNNLEAANVKLGRTKFACCDFRDYSNIEGLGPNTLTLVITNPPLGRRVPIPNLRGLIEDLLSVATTVLKPGGRLVFANPFRIEKPPRHLQLQSRQTVDFGGFDCFVEKYLKLAH